MHQLMQNAGEHAVLARFAQQQVKSAANRGHAFGLPVEGDSLSAVMRAHSRPTCSPGALQKRP
jgi:hypothetical protein